MRFENTDVLVVGGGAAGLYAAVSAASAQEQMRVTIATSSELGSGGCSKRTHGLNVAMNKCDSWQQHLEDTLMGGGGINNPALAETLCKGIRERVRELETWGVRFERNEEEYVVGTYGGSTFSRSIHWSDLTGLEITHELVKQVVFNRCQVRENRWLYDIDKENSLWVANFLNLDDGSVETIRAKSLVLATGGGACVYPISSISSDKQGTGIILGLMAGAEVVDMEMVQFHPTGLVLPGSIGHGCLLEEEMRAQGGELLNRNGERFMFNYDHRGEMATRDIVARSSYLEIFSGRGTDNGGVVFDLSRLDRNFLAKRFPHTIKRCRDWGVDLLAQEKVEISPTAHFLMGGLRINEDGCTSLNGLFACGEDAGGIHGGNRLGGNGLADALVFGARAGVAAVRYAEKCGPLDCLPRESDRQISLPRLDMPAIHQAESHLKDVMWRDVGLVRNKDGLCRAISAIKALEENISATSRSIPVQKFNTVHLARENMMLYNKVKLANAIANSAILRRNSIGAHFRTDNDVMPSGNTLTKVNYDGLVEVEYV